jgi:hypothetical protein
MIPLRGSAQFEIALDSEVVAGVVSVVLLSGFRPRHVAGCHNDFLPAELAGLRGRFTSLGRGSDGEVVVDGLGHGGGA